MKEYEEVPYTNCSECAKRKTGECDPVSMGPTRCSHDKMFKLKENMNNENEITVDGKVYVAVEADVYSCTGCAFIDKPCLSIKCLGSDFNGKQINWKLKEKAMSIAVCEMETGDGGFTNTSDRCPISLFGAGKFKLEKNTEYFCAMIPKKKGFRARTPEDIKRNPEDFAEIRYFNGEEWRLTSRISGGFIHIVKDKPEVEVITPAEAIAIIKEAKGKDVTIKL